MNAIPPTLIVGADGFIGQHLLAAYRKIQPGTLGTTRRQASGGLPFFDLERPDVNTLSLEDCRSAIITAAISRVDPCERDPEGTRRINVAGTLRLIEQLQARAILPIYLSSDYVFDGTSTVGYADEAPLCPSTEYGRHKAAVEEALSSSGRPYLVLRLSKIYGTERGDNSLLDEITRKLQAGQEVAAARDQVFCPSHVHDLAPGIMEIQRRGLTGVFNFCAAEPWSRYHLALAVAERLGVPTELVRPISLDDLPGNFRRPKCTVLLPRRLARETTVRFTPLREALDQCA